MYTMYVHAHTVMLAIALYLSTGPWKPNIGLLNTF